MKGLQKFSDEYLEQCSTLTAEQILRFLEDFRTLHTPAREVKTRLISIRVEEDLLEAFKTQAKLDGVPYQSRIKRLMRDSLSQTQSRE